MSKRRRLTALASTLRMPAAPVLRRRTARRRPRRPRRLARITMDAHDGRTRCGQGDAHDGRTRWTHTMRARRRGRTRCGQGDVDAHDAGGDAWDQRRCGHQMAALQQQHSTAVQHQKRSRGAGSKQRRSSARSAAHHSGLTAQVREAATTAAVIQKTKQNVTVPMSPIQPPRITTSKRLCPRNMMRHAPERAGGRPPQATRAAPAPPPAEAGAAGAYPPHPQITAGNPIREAWVQKYSWGAKVLGARSVRRQRYLIDGTRVPGRALLPSTDAHKADVPAAEPEAVMEAAAEAPVGMDTGGPSEAAAGSPARAPKARRGVAKPAKKVRAAAAAAQPGGRSGCRRQ